MLLLLTLGLLGLLTAVLLVVLLLTVLLTATESVRRRADLLAAAALGRAPPGLLREALGERAAATALPAHAAFPDVQPAEWANVLTAQLWPSIEQAASKFAMKDGLLEKVAATAALWSLAAHATRICACCGHDAAPPPFLPFTSSKAPE